MSYRNDDGDCQLCQVDSIRLLSPSSLGGSLTGRLPGSDLDGRGDRTVEREVEITGRTEQAISAEALRRHGVPGTEELNRRYAEELGRRYEQQAALSFTRATALRFPVSTLCTVNQPDSTEPREHHVESGGGW